MAWIMLQIQLSLSRRKLQQTDQNNKTTASILQHEPNLIPNKINSIITVSVDGHKWKGISTIQGRHEHVNA